MLVGFLYVTETEIYYATIEVEHLVNKVACLSTHFTLDLNTDLCRYRQEATTWTERTAKTGFYGHQRKNTASKHTCLHQQTTSHNIHIRLIIVAILLCSFNLIDNENKVIKSTLTTDVRCQC